ncbi:CD209 antigen-like protein B isoform X2 [Lepisosteus oculatus]|uniref:CD209 antigen-like protein B isoform X2 n=1 Tax=Lepisosteus oculatus TaxID=7918 RepID=UPI0035F51638
MSEEVMYSSVTFSKNCSRGTPVKQDEVTYAEVKTARAPSAQTAPPPGAPGKQDEVTYENVGTAGSAPAQTALSPEQPVKAPSIPLPYRLAAVCLGLLCAVLLIAIIVLIFFYNGNSQNISKLVKELDHLRVNYSNLTAAHNGLEVDFRNLTATHNKLQEDFRNLTVSYSNLTGINDKLQNKTEILQSLISKLKKHFSVEQYCPVTDQNTLEKDCRPCPWGWELFSTKCYYFSTDALSWNYSRTACRKLGADLVVINNRTEQEFIQKQIKGGEYWMGLSDAAAEGTWIWVDGTQPIEWYWMKNQPDDYENEDCLATATPTADQITSLNNWNDNKCELPLLRICEGSSLPLSP